ncbi:MAG: hypothetical protein R2825_07780 [Saprospiraceae bacterium]
MKRFSFSTLDDRCRGANVLIKIQNERGIDEVEFLGLAHTQDLKIATTTKEEHQKKRPDGGIEPACFRK